jgi:LysR family glycine cleavage system transcriptional activator
MPSLESLRVLAVCVRHGNFSRAAEELCVTPTAVSQRIRALEEEIGVKLFRRHGPALFTTDRAKALGQRLEHAFSLVENAVDDCRRVRHPLRVTCAPTFAARWLVPRLAHYQGLAGADAITLDASQSLSASGSFDVAIRSGPGPWPEYGAVRLLSDRRTPMLSPKRLPRGVLTPRKLLQLPLIPDPQWPAWFELAGLADARPRFAATRFPNYELEAQAAARGIGVALLSPLLFAELIAQGTLVAPFPWAIDGPNSYWLLTTKGAAESHFAKWLRSQFSEAGSAEWATSAGSAGRAPRNRRASAR